MTLISGDYCRIMQRRNHDSADIFLALMDYNDHFLPSLLWFSLCSTPEIDYSALSPFFFSSRPPPIALLPSSSFSAISDFLWSILFPNLVRRGRRDTLACPQWNPLSQDDHIYFSNLQKSVEDRKICCGTNNRGLVLLPISKNPTAPIYTERIRTFPGTTWRNTRELVAAE